MLRAFHGKQPVGIDADQIRRGVRSNMALDHAARQIHVVA